MKKPVKGVTNQKGFTFIEVISVLIIIGIVSAVLIARMAGTRDYDLNSQLEAVKSHLRLAQSMSMGLNAPYGITFSSQTTYYLFKGDAPATPILLSGEKTATVDLSAKESELRINSAPQVITFDAYGSPGNVNIVVASNAGNITITKNTGFIP